MPVQIEATELREAGHTPDGRAVLLSPLAARSWRAMHEKACTDGIRLLLLSGYRSQMRQQEIIARKLALGVALTDILAVNGYSG